MQTGYQMVWLAAERTPGHLAIVDDQSGRALTYKQLIAEVDEIAAGLHARGIGQGDRVATVLPSLFDHCLLLLALQRLAAVPALINYRLTADEIAQLIAIGEMKGAVTLADENVVDAVAGVLPGGAPLFTLGGAPGSALDFSDCRGDIMSLPCPDPDPDDLAFIFFTSGTTGLPKGVLLSHKTTEPRILWLSTQGGLRHGTHNRALGFMPLSHAIGFYGIFLGALAFNGTYFVMSQFDPAKAVDMVESHKITYMFAVPQLLFAMTKAPNYGPEKMKSMELVLFGGAAIDGGFLEQIDKEWAGDLRHIYGTTETMCPLYNPNPVGQATRLRAAFYSRIRIVKLGGGVDELVAPGEEGELIVDASADTVFTEYLNRPDATAEKMRDGWYFTGDVCLLHEDGDVDLIGRSDDIIRSGGENIHPGEIEDILAAHPGVADVAVIGLADKKWGEAVTACVVSAADALLAADLDEHFKASSIADFKRPREYVFLDQLPRNAANKVLRNDLKKIARAAKDDEN